MNSFTKSGNSKRQLAENKKRLVQNYSGLKKYQKYGTMVDNGESLEDMRIFYQKNYNDIEKIKISLGTGFKSLGFIDDEIRKDRRNYDSVKKPHIYNSVWKFSLINYRENIIDTEFIEGLEKQENGIYHCFVLKSAISTTDDKISKPDMFPKVNEPFMAFSRINKTLLWYKIISIELYKYPGEERYYDCAKVNMIYCTYQETDVSIDSIKSESYLTIGPLRDLVKEYVLKYLKYYKRTHKLKRVE